MKKIEIEIDENIEIIKNTILRLSYIFTDYNFSHEYNKIIIEGKNLIYEEIKEKVFYYIYKEKINLQNASIRKKIYESF